MLAYLARYTHRIAISNARLIRLDDKGVTFKWKDYPPATRLAISLMKPSATSRSRAVCSA